METAVELRQLRYFVAVAEELHFGRAAERLHMSQSPLSRAIRDLEREVGVTLFVRTTRRVELTSAGAALLERARRALGDIDSAVADARRSGDGSSGIVGFGFNPVGALVAQAIAARATQRDARFQPTLDEDTSPALLRRLAAGELAAAVVLHSASAAEKNGVRVDALKDEQLLAALPSSHRYATADAIPMAAFVEEPVLLPREPAGQAYLPWVRAAFQAAGYELDRMVQTANAQWDRRLLPVANGEAVGVVAADWGGESTGVVLVPLDPPLTMPLDLASCWPPTETSELLVEAACELRDAEGWLTRRAAHTELPRR
jgi:DNA-binding transcriptional LysR family regulator